jgi:hypothetical protein
VTQQTPKHLTSPWAALDAARFCAALATLTLTLLSVVLLGTGQAAAQPKPNPKTNIEVQPNNKVKLPPLLLERENWRKSMVKTQRPKKGCFTATYPETSWKEVACGAAPKKPYPPRAGIRPQTVGNGVDFSAEVTANTSAAEGSFDSVAGVTSETDGTANSFSLQLNTNFFSTSTCAGAANPATCLGWEQFIYENPGGGGSGFAFIQYWLINWNNPCPGGWNSFSGDCFINSAAATAVPAQTIAALGTMKVDGLIGDSVTFSLGGTLFTAAGDNHFPDLTNGWRMSEFNIVGNGGGSEASFNAGSTIVVRTAVNSGMPAVPPTCNMSGFTGETNNLTLVSTPTMEPDVNWPSIIFTQTNNAPTPVSCANADSIGDTHLKTFNGLMYDFQASGDFVLASAPGFQVQARQASGAPTWPNASVNKGVAVELGSTKVALYIEPTRLFANGQAKNLDDGKSLELGGGVQVTRHGNVYLISDEHGNSVRATLNSTWMDLNVGLGHTPQLQAHGLLGTPNQNAQALVTNTGAVLRMPVAFNDLYHPFADGWRVQPNQSLFSEATTIRFGIPEKLFTANHLNPQDRARALAICKANHITSKDLLDACTLDTAVLNDEAAAKVFVRTTRPLIVLKTVDRVAPR